MRNVAVVVETISFSMSKSTPNRSENDEFSVCDIDSTIMRRRFCMSKSAVVFKPISASILILKTISFQHRLRNFPLALGLWEAFCGLHSSALFDVTLKRPALASPRLASACQLPDLLFYY